MRCFHLCRVYRIFPAHCSFQLVQALILGKLGYSISATTSRRGQVTSAVMVTAARNGHHLTSGHDPSVALMRCWLIHMPATLLATCSLTMTRG